MKRAFSSLILIGVATFTLTACRTAQQARRNSSGRRAANRPGATAAGQSVANDSLLMVEHRLVAVIDSLTSLVHRDHSRIKALEDQLNAMRARMYGGGGGQSYRSGPNDPQTYTAPEPYVAPQLYIAPQSYTAPPSYTVPPAAPLPPQFVETPAARPATPTTSIFDDRYVTARRMFMENDFSEALDGFKSLERDDPHGPLAANYLYWQGESLYALKQYNAALQQFNLVVQEFPASNKVDDAQFKIGESYERMGLKSSAKAAYQSLLSKYPYSADRARAEARLRKLR